MNKEAVRDIALACGFSLNKKIDDTIDLDTHVYKFAGVLLSRERRKRKLLDTYHSAQLFVAMRLINGGDILPALDIIRDVYKYLIDTGSSLDASEPVEDMEYQDLLSKESLHDPVNHPSHYTSHPSGIEAIEITRHMGFNLGNAIKYLWRNGLKDGQPALQDLEKAVWYIQDEISRIKG